MQNTGKPQLGERGLDLAGRVVVITGGAGGIGAGVAKIVAEAGATTVIADLDGARAEQQAAALKQAGHKAGHVAIDVASEASVVQGCAAILAAYGTPWALVNNAGVQDRQLLLDATTSDWDRTLAVNTRGPFLMTREVARAMVANEQGGRIVNIASTAAIGALVRGHAAYAASKAALLGLARACALELAEHAVTVNTVLPGGVATPGAIGAKGPPPDGPARRRPPLGMCEPRDIGAAVLFLASPMAGRITNQALAVDGGWSIT